MGLGACSHAHRGLFLVTTSAELQTDRGSQYACGDYSAALERLGFAPSTSRKGNCWNNAVAKSFFSPLKTGLVHQRHFATHAEARVAIFKYFEAFYNRQTNRYLSPAEFEARASQAIPVPA
jgi:putative transposase